MKNGNIRGQAGWAITALMFLAGFVLGAAAITSYFWATGQLKGRIYLGVAPPTARTPAAPRRAPLTAAPPGAAPSRSAAPEAPAQPPGIPAHPAPQAVAPAQPAPAQVAGALPADVQYLLQRRLLIPVAGATPQALHDDFNDSRGGRRHEALDILAPPGAPVLAVDDGAIAKLFDSKRGGLTIYQFDPSRTYSYYYAHLSRYAAGLEALTAVKRGQVIGYVGSTGDANAAAPHLHFAINRLLPGKNWWQGTPIDPYPFLASSMSRR